MKSTLALDLGTTSIAAVAVSGEGRIIARAERPNSSAIEGLPPGHVEQSPQRLRAIALEVLGELARELHVEPHCIGITGQMHGLMLLDSQRTPVTNLFTWQDRRANELSSPGNSSYLETYLEKCSAGALEKTGCRLSPGYMAVTFYVLARQNRLPRSAAYAAFPADWIAAELCDSAIVTDRSNAASSGVYNLQEDRWSEELISAGGLSTELFPPVKESGSIVGELTTDIAAATGLPAGLPVCNAIGDNQAAVLGSVPSGNPAIQINIGTGGQINWPVNQFLRVEGMDTRYLPQQRFILVGAGLIGGDAYAWVQRTVSDWLGSLGLKLSEGVIFARMNELAAQLPAENDGLTCEPLFRGTRRMPNARATFAGIDNENFTLGHISRAVMQGIADGMYSFYQKAGAARPGHLQHIIGSGNGLRKNKLLIEILEKRFDREILVPVHQQEAAFGAALLAGSQTGLWPDLESAGSGICLVPAREAD